jgi:phosphoribosylaminoimidazolecarboxamide formyltransferase/IMP cyclohydrolase
VVCVLTIGRAFFSASDKSGLVELAGGLAELGVELMASGGTARHLRAASLDVIDLSDYTGTPHLVGGRVKTLHPLVYAGILARRTDEGDRADVEIHDVRLIDLVVVNLYPFESAVSGSTPADEATELIDIGGVSLIRAAAKNHRWVAVLTDFADYHRLLDELREHGGIRDELAHELARKAFDRVIRYDAAIADYFAGEALPRQLNLALPRARPLRAGENKHQAAAQYGAPEGVIQHQGRDPSYNNLLDLDAALRIPHSFDDPTAVFIKHTNPCGLCSADTIEEALHRAYQADAKSAFGGLVGVNRPLTSEGAELLAGHFFDAVIAPDYAPGALEILARRKKLLVLEAGAELLERGLGMELHATAFGVVAQTPSTGEISREALQVVSARRPTAEEIEELLFAWRAVRWVKSNAILLSAGRCTTGIGAGQMSRVDAVELAIRKAGDRAAGSVLASDAFFPFRDSIDLAATAGITAAIEPGGSVRDEEVIAAADELGLALVFTGHREFRH